MTPQKEWRVRKGMEEEERGGQTEIEREREETRSILAERQ